MSNWKYLVEDVGNSASVDSLQGMLNDSGSQGWELVSMMILPSGGKLVAIFKKSSGESTQN
jgi:hypothetical protein